jgi:hypothetical protein
MRAKQEMFFKSVRNNQCECMQSSGDAFVALGTSSRASRILILDKKVLYTKGTNSEGPWINRLKNKSRSRVQTRLKGFHAIDPPLQIKERPVMDVFHATFDQLQRNPVAATSNKGGDWRHFSPQR